MLRLEAIELLESELSKLKESFNEGNSLYAAMANHPKQFPSVYINMIKAGEASGAIDVVLNRLADFEEHQRALLNRFKAALVYPLFMCVVGAVVIAVLFTFVIPNITQIFLEMGQVLPLPTVVLIATSSFLKSWWWLVLVAMVILIAIIHEFVKLPKGRYLWDKAKLSLPGLGDLNRKLFLSRFARTLASR